MACAQPWATARGPGDAPNPPAPASDAAGVAHALPAQRKATTDSMHATLRAQPTTACAPSSKAPPQHRQCRRYTHVGQQRSCIAQGLPAAQRQTARPSDARNAPRGTADISAPPRLIAHTPRRPGGYRQPPGWTGRVAAVGRHKDAGQGQRTATAARRPITPTRATHAMRPYAQGTASADTGSRQAATAAVRQPTLEAGQHRLRCSQPAARLAQLRRETGG